MWIDAAELRYTKVCIDANVRERGGGAYEEWEWAGSVAGLAGDPEVLRKIHAGLGPRGSRALARELERVAPGVAEWSRELATPALVEPRTSRSPVLPRVLGAVRSSSSSWLWMGLLVLFVLGIALTLGRVGLIGLERGAHDLAQVWHAHAEDAVQPTAGELIAKRAVGRVEREAATAKGVRSKLVTWEGEVTFRYSRDGRPREGVQRIVLSDHVGAEAELSRRLAEYQVGASVVVYADANGTAVLEPASRPGVGTALLGLFELLLGAVFVGIVPGLLAFGLWGGRKRG